MGQRPPAPGQIGNMQRDEMGAAEGPGVPLLGPLWRWWLNRTSNVRYPAIQFDERIRARRSRIGSAIFLGLIVLALGLAAWNQLTVQDLPTLYASLVALVGVLIGCVLNRYNQVELAGALVALVIDAAIFGAVLSAPGGLLDTDYLGSYYLMALILGVVAILMPAWGLLVATAVNCALILADFLVLQHYTPALAQQLGTDGYFFEIGRPIFLNIGIAFALYVLVRTLLDEGRRADRAEVIAEMEERELGAQRVLEREVRELLAVHVQLANGNFNARVPQLSNPLLWQIGASLNNLMNRLARLGQADFVNQRMQQESMRLAEALRMLLEGRTPVWPAPTGAPTDMVLAAVQAVLARLAAGDAQLLRQLSQGSYGPVTGQTGQLPAGFRGQRAPLPPPQQGVWGEQGPASDARTGRTSGERPPWRAPQLQSPAPDVAGTLGMSGDPETGPFGPGRSGLEGQWPPASRSGPGGEESGDAPFPPQPRQ